jgi:undecaprenyl diphosphate synthase
MCCAVINPDSPKYVAIIADGNGRWASKRGLSVGDGHRAGAENVRACLRDAAEFGIRELTIFAFSTENWERPAEEVTGLMELLAEYIDFVTPELNDEGVRLRFIGDRKPPMPVSLVEKMNWAEQLTAANELLTFFVPINYGGRAEILQAAEKFTGSTEEDFAALLYAPDMHDPELLIRAGAEQRISNFLLWQAADAFLVFSKEMWPEFSRESFEAAIEEYRGAQARRKRECSEIATSRSGDLNSNRLLEADGPSPAF